MWQNRSVGSITDKYSFFLFPIFFIFTMLCGDRISLPDKVGQKPLQVLLRNFNSVNYTIPIRLYKVRRIRLVARVEENIIRDNKHCPTHEYHSIKNPDGSNSTIRTSIPHSFLKLHFNFQIMNTSANKREHKTSTSRHLFRFRFNSQHAKR